MQYQLLLWFGDTALIPAKVPAVLSIIVYTDSAHDNTEQIRKANNSLKLL